MKTSILVVAALTLGTLMAFAAPAQQTTPQTPQSPTVDPDTPRKVGGDVTQPILTKSAKAKYPPYDLAKSMTGTVVVGLVVDRKGHPTNLQIIHSAGDDLDKSALEAVSHYRFEPATENGRPVPVLFNVTVNFGQTLKGDVHAPVLIKSAEPIPPSVHRTYLAVVVNLLVSENGEPENVHIIRSSGDWAFDKSAIDAVRQYRFKPATEAGKPVQTEINVKIDLGIH
jgi:TonB family protein